MAPASIHENEVFEAEVRLHSESIPASQLGAEGWQLGVAHDGLELIDLTLAGTAAGQLEDGFAFLEAASAEGFVSGVILSLGEQRVTLPPSGAATVARARYRVLRQGCAEGAALELRDGLQRGGVDIECRVVQNNTSHLAQKGWINWARCATSAYRLSLLPEANPLAIRSSGPEELTLRVLLEQSWLTARAWNLAISHDPAILTLLEVRLDGTGILEQFRDDGFALFEATQGPGNTGFLARVDLSPRAPHTLPVASQIILNAIYRVQEPAALPPGEFQTTITFAESLRGSLGRLSNEVFPQGFLETPRGLTLTLDNVEFRPFVRGDANGDAGVDIGDVLETLLHLFRGRPAPCLAALNANADRRLDLADPLATLAFLFRAAPPPRPPWPFCGGRDSFTGFDCRSGRACE